MDNQPEYSLEACKVLSQEVTLAPVFDLCLCNRNFELKIVYFGNFLQHFVGKDPGVPLVFRQGGSLSRQGQRCGWQWRINVVISIGFRRQDKLWVEDLWSKRQAADEL